MTEGESDNFYHFHDNRVLPPGIDQERAKAEGANAYFVQYVYALGAFHVQCARCAGRRSHIYTQHAYIQHAFEVGEKESLCG